MLRLGSGHLSAQAIHVFAKLGIADLLREGDKTVDDLARSTATDGAALSRVLRFLATIGVVDAHDSDCYSLTPLGSTLCTQSSEVIRDNVLLMSSPGYWGAIGNLLDAVRTGENAFEGAHGRRFFDYLEHHADEGKVFNAAMNSSSKVGHSATLSAYDFGSAEVIVDVAGGKGSFLESVLKNHPASRGILLDSASVIEAATINGSVTGRVTRVPGDFFDGVPGGGDLYVLRRILHDWSDEKAATILRRCREACHAQARLLIIEAAPPEEHESANNWAGIDLLMMILMDGRERTAADFERLFASTGFRLSRIVRTNSPLWLVEALPV